MSAQKGVVHTRANSEERSHTPVVTSQNPRGGGWNISDPLTDEYTHVMLSHAGQGGRRTLSLRRTTTKRTHRTGQNGQNRARQGRAGQFRHIHPQGAASFFLGCG